MRVIESGRTEKVDPLLLLLLDLRLLLKMGEKHEKH